MSVNPQLHMNFFMQCSSWEFEAFGGDPNKVGFGMQNKIKNNSPFKIFYEDNKN